MTSNISILLQTKEKKQSKTAVDPEDVLLLQETEPKSLKSEVSVREVCMALYASMEMLKCSPFLWQTPTQVVKISPLATRSGKQVRRLSDLSPQPGKKNTSKKLTFALQKNKLHGMYIRICLCNYMCAV